MADDNEKLVGKKTPSSPVKLPDALEGLPEDLPLETGKGANFPVNQLKLRARAKEINREAKKRGGTPPR